MAVAVFGLRSRLKTKPTERGSAKMVKPKVWPRRGDSSRVPTGQRESQSFAMSPPSAVSGFYSSGWHTHLAQLIAQLEGAPRPPFWPMHAKLKAEYEKLRPAALQH